MAAVDQARAARLFDRLPDPEAREELVHLYQPLAHYLASRYVGRGEERDDLEQVASLALLNAIDRFDPDRGVRFSTFATPTILGTLKRHFRDQGWAMRVPRRLKTIQLETRRATDDLWQELGRSPSLDELVERTGYDEEEILEARFATTSYTPNSLEWTAPEDDGSSIGDRIGSDDRRLESIEWMASLEPAVASLTERQRRILHLRFFEGKTQAEIGEEVGVSQMQVSRLLRRMLDDLQRKAHSVGAAR